jgi:hypothetical protein
MSFIEKYTPQKIEDIIGNTKKYKKICSEIKKKNKGKFLIVGSKGTGKTSFVNIISKQKKYKICKININDVSSKSNNDEIKLYFKKSILKKIILIDGITINDINRSSIESKLKILGKFMNNDKSNLTFILSTNDSKIFGIIEGLHKHKLSLPTEDEIKEYVLKIIKNEKVEISKTKSDKIIDKLLSSSKNDLHKIINDIDFLLKNNKKKLKLTNDNKKIMTNMKNDVNYVSKYELMKTSFKKTKIDNPEKLKEKENIFYNDTFLIPNSTYEYYLKGDNLNINNMKYAIESIADGDMLNQKLSITNNYSHLPYINYSSYIIPSYLCGNVKTNFFFPVNVSKCNKIKNNNNKILTEKFSKNMTNVKNEDVLMIHKIQKNMKLKKKDELMSGTLLKSVFTL